MELPRRPSALRHEAPWRIRVREVLAAGQGRLLGAILEQQIAHLRELTGLPHYAAFDMDERGARPLGETEVHDAMSMAGKAPEAAFALFVFGAGQVIARAEIAASSYEGIIQAGERIERLLVGRLGLAA